MTTLHETKTMKRLELGHIVCPIDLSGQFQSSVTYATAIARAHKAELRAVHVVSSEGVASSEGVSALEHERLMEQLRECLLETNSAYEFIGAAVRQGDPGTQILDFARRLRANLIVMGAPGAERPMGPVAAVVVGRSDCPVLTVPTHPTTPSNESGVFSRVVCAVDLAPSSVSVIRQALSIAWETEGRLIYACVLSEDDSISDSKTRDDLLSAIPPEGSRWCDMDITVTRGTPSLEIMRLIAEQRADLLVVGAPRRWTSTVGAVLGQSPCPVLVTHDAQPLPWPAMTRDSTGAADVDPK
ncbi:MAG TPA: universal stress protein [Vicinamibacterales bacterium]|nr:universal stress protein [Vicinamibacterales bacterium]